MAGRMGAAQATVKNLEVVEYADGILLVKGLIPGPISSIVTITRRGANKKHVGLYKEPVVEEEIVEAKVEEVGDTVEEQEAQRQEVEEEVKAEAAAEEIAQEAKADVVEETPVEVVEEGTEATDATEEVTEEK